MQIFGFLYARKINDEINIFKGFFSNYLFLMIVLAIIVLQYIIVTFGDIVFMCYTYGGLSLTHWMMCAVFGLIGLIWNFVLKFIPDHWVLLILPKRRTIGRGMTRSRSKEGYQAVHNGEADEVDEVKEGNSDTTSVASDEELSPDSETKRF